MITDVFVCGAPHSCYGKCNQLWEAQSFLKGRSSTVLPYLQKVNAPPILSKQRDLEGAMVTGEVYSVTLDTLIVVMDRFMGCPQKCQREMIPVWLYGKVIYAWAYLH